MNETLAGIPSIIYGLVGMLVFAQTMGFKTCLLSGSLTLVIMNLPTIIRTRRSPSKRCRRATGRRSGPRRGQVAHHPYHRAALQHRRHRHRLHPAVGRIVGESAALLFTAGAAEVIAGSIAKAYTSNGATLSVLLYLRASRTATLPPPGASAQCCWFWCFSSTSQPVWQKQSSNRNSKPLRHR